MSGESVRSELVYRFVARELSQPYDHWEENHPDEDQFVLQITTEFGEPVTEHELLYCGYTQFSDIEPLEVYRSEVKRYIETYSWIPASRESRHHRSGIHHNQQTAAPQGHGFLHGSFESLDHLIPSRPIPFLVFPQSIDTWVRTQRVLSEELIAFLKSRPGGMRSLKSDVFEQLVLELLAGLGYEVQWVGRKSDISGDGIVVGALPGGLEFPMLLEAKCYAEHQRVSVHYADKLYGAMQRQGYPGAILATTSSFTKGVWSKYGKVLGFHLKEFNDMVEWLTRYEPAARLHLEGNC
jgi:hypothetical protein